MNNTYNFNHHMKVTFSGSFEWSLYTGLTVLICLLNAILFTIIYRRWLHIRKTPHAFSLPLLHLYVHYTAYLLLGRNIPSYNGIIIIIITKSITWMYKIILYSNMTSFKRFESKPVVKIIYIYTDCNLWRLKSTIYNDILPIFTY